MEDIEGFFLTPPLFGLNGLRIDTPVRNLTATYRRDVVFFKANPDRRMMLRTADRREFDMCAETVGEWSRLPTLHVFVHQLSIGMHQVSPTYRGRSFFEAPTTDSETATIVAEMYARGGIDPIARAQCDELFRQSKNNTELIQRRSKDEVVH